MSCINSNILAGASGSAGGDPVYVDDLFSSTVYTGTNNVRSVSTGIDNTEKSLIWIKGRDYAHEHYLFDTERINVNACYLMSQSNSVENCSKNLQFTSNGFTLDPGLNTGQNQLNTEFVAWNWKAAPGWFDIVTWTGNGTAGRQIPHALGSVPGMIIVKSTSNPVNWEVYHRSLTSTHYLSLNRTDLAAASSSRWNNTSPTSTHFTVGNSNSGNYSGWTYVAYVFAHDDAQFGTDSDESIVKCGTYTGNGSTTGPVINLGFEPQFLMVKQTSQSGANWVMVDTMRGMTADGEDRQLYANLTSVESLQTRLAPLANGFQPRFAGYEVNTSGQTYIYMAIRRPNKPPEVATEVFTIDTQGGTSPTPPGFNSTFPVDLVLTADPAVNSARELSSRLQQGKAFRTDTSVPEQNESNFKFDYSYGFKDITGTSSTTLAYMFKRAPGFMDVVGYTGTGSIRTINHNLGAIPELMIVKRKNGSQNFQIYHSAVGINYYHPGFRTDPFYQSSNRWNDTLPTASVFTLKTDGDVNNSGDPYMNFLFATLPGISKVGSYSGNTGYAVNVDCGFTNGARFILIKRSDLEIGGTPGTSWFVWDTTRGITSGNDPYFILNDTAVQTTNTDYIDPLSTGFTVTASAPAALNATGGTYIFLAIA